MCMALSGCSDGVAVVLCVFAPPPHIHTAQDSLSSMPNAGPCLNYLKIHLPARSGHYMPLKSSMRRVLTHANVPYSAVPGCRGQAGGCGCRWVDAERCAAAANPHCQTQCRRCGPILGSKCLHKRQFFVRSQSSPHNTLCSVMKHVQPSSCASMFFLCF